MGLKFAMMGLGVSGWRCCARIRFRCAAIYARGLWNTRFLSRIMGGMGGSPWTNGASAGNGV